ncbi:Cytochrome P450 [Amycolatopsis tolypomycina]|uniref:Cytochrome P450 n=2 Tax=Amycolatopsis tolypomycina TaxID=208445 RepID=A0A1H4JI65_9PSEU|nr:cytochrome P450 [Amycolatopsis tolypomycina]SEB46019.1 Cytochrome P450 [Amycolatopsis tolypomycina]
MAPELFCGPDYWEQAHESATALRERGSAQRVTLPSGVSAWVISDYADARAALADKRLSKDGAGLRRVLGEQLVKLGKDPEQSRMFGDSMLMMDDPRHAELRSLVSPLFTPGRIQLLRPRIERLVAEMLEELPRREPVDVIEHVAFPLPLIVICELLGIPLDERDPMREWTAALMEDDPDRVLPASHAMQDRFDKLIVAKREAPDDGLLSALVQLCDSGDISGDELMDMVFLLFVAGHEASTNLVGNGMRHLLADPARWRLLGQRPALIPRAVEEMLRYDCPIRMAPYRRTTEPVRYGDVVIPAGEIVLVSLLSAGRDPAQYPQPDELDVYRDAKHLSFGQGIHYCLGAPLARLEAEIVFTALTRAFPRARLAIDESQLRHKPSVIMHGLVRLPVLLGGRTSPWDALTGGLRRLIRWPARRRAGTGRQSPFARSSPT